MKNSRKFILLPLILMALSLSGCNFFSYLFTSSSNTSRVVSFDDSIFYSSVTTSESNSSNNTSVIDSSLFTSSELTGGKTPLKYNSKDYLSNHYQSLDTSYSTGDVNFLIIPVWLSDSSYITPSHDKDSIHDDLETAFFGSEEETGWQSVSSYYNKDSFGKLNIQGEVASWYNASYSYSQINSANVVDRILVSAVNNWKTSKTEEEIKQFDLDSNGYLDAICLIYAGPDYSTYSSNKSLYPTIHSTNSNMWAYVTWNTRAISSVSSPNGKSYMWASYDFMYRDVEHVNLDTHTYIHESGHLFGLDDYYDYQYSSSAGTGYIASGGFSMQDYNLGGHDPYSALALGWVEPYVPIGNATYKINTYESSGDLILLNDNFSGSAFDEYILIELYSPTGLNELDVNYSYNSRNPKGPNKLGIRIWHVDARMFQINGTINNPNNISVTTDIIEGKKYIQACTNSTYVNTDSDNMSILTSYYNYNILELIRRGDYLHTNTKEFISNSDLFIEGDTFSFSDYRYYFTNGNIVNRKMNNGDSFSWYVEILEIDETNKTATIRVSK